MPDTPNFKDTKKGSGTSGKVPYVDVGTGSNAGGIRGSVSDRAPSGTRVPAQPETGSRGSGTSAFSATNPQARRRK